MPYIHPTERLALTNGTIDIQTAGQLNFCFTMLALDYLETKGENYQTYNDILGALEGAKLELYRRRIELYEDKKISENGDVYRRGV